ncbi:hypothetical protein BGW36DRAFT_308974 [Talaromyces proteolyticus]|uniref:FAD-binding domain-containing protein n=1 Tax=Talaromyces proteolyticus TaxID=1131652 RepID=A0AAD4KDD1_9EURO|nr:uncharacterized protein BGW36DRAFT_308974 [Talaromyces proteolyticus]KAH8689017.1 hypothetical protein BGW36DRAFT_308974 [Talaromyces proteolyticus]
MADQTKDPEPQLDCDVLIVGAGPVGLTLALLLSEYRDYKIIVLERHPALFPLPRAVSLSHDNLRVYDGLGLHDAAFKSAITDIRDSVSNICEFIGASGQTLARIPYNWDSKSGTSSTFALHQPSLEEVLGTACAEKENICVIRATQVEHVRDLQTHVEIWTDAEKKKWTARFVVGCDGANSIVRESAGIDLVDCPGNKSRWLVVDVAPVSEEIARNWKDYSGPRQYLDPQRPRSAVFRVRERRRWEFLILPGESPEKAVDPGFIWPLLKDSGLGPENAVLDRAAMYVLKGAWAETFNKGRIFLAGDAAHVTPPFTGQGLNSGVRDAASLSWRLDLALRYPDRTSEQIFDDWTAEQLGRVRKLISTSVSIESMVTMTDSVQAAARDENFLELLRSPVPNPEHLGTPGLFDNSAEQESVAGKLFMDGVVEIKCKQGRLCDHFGSKRWLLLKQYGNVDGQETLGAKTNNLFSDVLRGKIIKFGEGDQYARDMTGNILKWLQEHRAVAVLVRPDNYVYGIARSVDEIDSLVLRAILHVGIVLDE